MARPFQKLLGPLGARENPFFGLLKSSAANLLEVSQLLDDLFQDYQDVPARVAEIKRLEEVGDHIIHEIMRNLHRTFITPLDREDIAALGERLDDVVDAIEEAARYMVEYRIPEPSPAAKELAHIIRQASQTLLTAMTKLPHRGGKLREILPDAVEVNRLENEADHVFSHAMAQLFNDATSPMEVLKWRDIYSQLEQATDMCEDVANVLEAIVLKNA
ncbi:MAG: DUF47 domain-containing protein [Chloroflexi bacterium]|nr:DUF47 domain-containing protein [Chloroflexota bacterium]